MAEQKQLAVVTLETLHTTLVHRAVQGILKVSGFVAEVASRRFTHVSQLVDLLAFVSVLLAALFVMSRDVLDGDDALNRISGCQS